MAKRNVTSPREVRGRLENHIEPSTGTVIWAFRKENARGYGYGVARPLKNGDHIRVFNDAARKNEIWSGDIDLDFTCNKAPIPTSPHITAQRIKNVGTVHGVQKGVDPEIWGDMFVSGKPAAFTPGNPFSPTP